MSQTKTVIKNIISLMLSNVISAILGVLLVMYLARYLGPEGYGTYAFAFAFAQILSFSVEFGIYYIIIRDVARNKELAMKYILSACILKILFMIPVFMFIVTSVKLISISPEKSVLICLISLSLFLNYISQTFRGIFNAFEKMEYTALTSIILSVISTALTLFLIFSEYVLFESKIIPIALVLIFAGAIDVLISGTICFKKFVKFELVKTDLKFLKYLLKEAFPLELQQIIVLVYMQSFIIFLSFYCGDAATGIFRAAQSLIMHLITIPMIAAFALCPVMSKLFVNSKNELKKVIKKATKILFVISLFITIFCFALAEKIIIFLYGVEYLSSVILFQLLVFAFLINGTFYVISYSILAANRQKYYTINSFITCTSAIILNLLLIPKYEAIGAAIAMFLSFICNNILYIYFSNKSILKLKISEIINLTTKFASIAIIGMCTFVMIFYLSNSNLILACVIPPIFYFCLIYLTRIISNEDIEIIKTIVKK